MKKEQDLFERFKQFAKDEYGLTVVKSGGKPFTFKEFQEFFGFSPKESETNSELFHEEGEHLPRLREFDFQDIGQTFYDAKKISRISYEGLYKGVTIDGHPLRNSSPEMYYDLIAWWRYWTEKEE